MSSFPQAEFEAMSRRLEEFHELFHCLWKIGTPIYSQEIETAAIQFSGSGRPLRFLIHPDFWAELPTYDREFVLCHEMLHVALNHGARGVGFEDERAANIAADLVVNHLLVEQFGFVRELLQDWKSLCWVDTVFPPKSIQPPTNYSFELYYSMLVNRKPHRECRTIDVHLPLRVGTGSHHARAIAEVDAHIDRLSPEVFQDLVDKLGKEAAVTSLRGTGASTFIEVARRVNAPSMPWDEVLRRKLLRTATVEGETWRTHSRRLGPNPALVLPGMGELPNAPRRRSCAFFLDLSGSCWPLKDRFVAIAESLPGQDFVTSIYTFDMHVHTFDPKGRCVLGGGGTSFAIIEQFLVSDQRKYPDHVVVLTDGLGDDVEPRHPERWSWLLTVPYEELVPSASYRRVIDLN